MLQNQKRSAQLFQHFICLFFRKTLYYEIPSGNGDGVWFDDDAWMHGGVEISEGA